MNPTSRFALSEQSVKSYSKNFIAFAKHWTPEKGVSVCQLAFDDSRGTHIAVTVVNDIVQFQVQASCTSGRWQGILPVMITIDSTPPSANLARAKTPRDWSIVYFVTIMVLCFTLSMGIAKLSHAYPNAQLIGGGLLVGITCAGVMRLLIAFNQWAERSKEADAFLLAAATALIAYWSGVFTGHEDALNTISFSIAILAGAALCSLIITLIRKYGGDENN